MKKIINKEHEIFFCYRFALFNDASTLYGLFKVKMWLISKCFIVFYAYIFSVLMNFNWTLSFIYNHFFPPNNVIAKNPDTNNVHSVV